MDGDGVREQGLAVQRTERLKETPPLIPQSIGLHKKTVPWPRG
jgi:hypothetical protein